MSKGRGFKSFFCGRHFACPTWLCFPSNDTLTVHWLHNGFVGMRAQKQCCLSYCSLWRWKRYQNAPNCQRWDWWWWGCSWQRSDVACGRHKKAAGMLDRWYGFMRQWGHISHIHQKYWYKGTTTSVGSQCTIFTLIMAKNLQWINPRWLSGQDLSYGLGWLGWDGSGWLGQLWTAQSDGHRLGNLKKLMGSKHSLVDLYGVMGWSADVFGWVKPKKFDGEPAHRHFWTHRGGLGPWLVQ